MQPLDIFLSNPQKGGQNCLADTPPREHGLHECETGRKQRQEDNHGQENTHRRGRGKVPVYHESVVDPVDIKQKKAEPEEKTRGKGPCGSRFHMQGPKERDKSYPRQEIES